MRLFALFLVILLATACAGEPEPAREDPALAPAQTPQTTTPDGDGGKGTLDIVGNARLGKVVSPEWVRIEGFTKQFYNGELDKLYGSFSAAYKQEFSMQDLIDLRDKMLTEYGEEIEVVATREEEKQDYRAFFRAARFSNDERLIEIAFVIGPDETIGGLYVTPDRGDQSPVQ
jgi:hypothetical protein